MSTQPTTATAAQTAAEPDPTSKYHKEIDLIQDIIKRMAQNSFQVKTWMVGILTAIVALKNDLIFSGGTTSGYQSITLLATLFIPVISFWYLDGFFLQREKLYREVYKWVVANRSLTKKYLYDLNTFSREDFVNPNNPKTILTDEAGSVWRAMTRRTVILFYLIPFSLVTGLIVLNYVKSVK